MFQFYDFEDLQHAGKLHGCPQSAFLTISGEKTFGMLGIAWMPDNGIFSLLRIYKLWHVSKLHRCPEWAYFNC